MDDRWRMLCCDSLVSMLRDQPSDSVDATISDHPYSSGGAHRGDRVVNRTNAKYQNSETGKAYPEFHGDTRDQRGFLAWATLWLGEAYRMTKVGGVGAVFSDWRQLAQTSDAFQAAGWVFRGIVPWDKIWARPQLGRFAAVAEFVVWGSKGPMPSDRGVGVLQGVFHVDESAAHAYDPPSMWRVGVNPDDKHHVAGKPIALMREIVKLCAPGGIVFDPFAGSGSTGVAALLEGRRFLGMEMSEEYCAIAERRLEETASASHERGAQLGLAL